MSHYSRCVWKKSLTHWGVSATVHWGGLLSSSSHPPCPGQSWYSWGCWASSVCGRFAASHPTGSYQHSVPCVRCQTMWNYSIALIYCLRIVTLLSISRTTYSQMRGEKYGKVASLPNTQLVLSPKYPNTFTSMESNYYILIKWIYLTESKGGTHTQTFWF